VTRELQLVPSPKTTHIDGLGLVQEVLHSIRLDDVPHPQLRIKLAGNAAVRKKFHLRSVTNDVDAMAAGRKA